VPALCRGAPLDRRADDPPAPRCGSAAGELCAADGAALTAALVPALTVLRLGAL
jgi:hypothetical protein